MPLISRKLKSLLIGVALLPVFASSASGASFVFTTIDNPAGVLGTRAIGVNNATDIVGEYFDAGGTRHGYLLSGGTFTTIDFPGGTESSAHGVNDSLQISGEFFDGTNYHGFLRNPGPAYTQIDAPFPGAFDTTALGINNAGTIVGAYVTNPTGNHGYIRTSAGAFTPLDVPGGIDTIAFGINDGGSVVGGFCDPGAVPPACNGHGFLFNGVFVQLDVPGGTDTEAHDINNAGDIVGSYFDGTSFRSFLLSGGVYTTFDFPGGFDTEAYGINDAGQIVGAYFDATGTAHGFLATPAPAAVSEPSALALFALGLTGLMVGARRRGSAGKA